MSEIRVKAGRVGNVPMIEVFVPGLPGGPAIGASYSVGEAKAVARQALQRIDGELVTNPDQTVNPGIFISTSHGLVDGVPPLDLDDARFAASSMLDMAEAMGRETGSIG